MWADLQEGILELFAERAAHDFGRDERQAWMVFTPKGKRTLLAEDPKAAWKKRNREKVRAQKKRWAERHRERRLAYKRAYYAAKKAREAS